MDESRAPYHHRSDHESPIDEVWRNVLKDIQSIDPVRVNWRAQVLPLARIKKIMRLEEVIQREMEREQRRPEEVSTVVLPSNDHEYHCIRSSTDINSYSMMIAGEAPALISKACEMLIKDLTARAWVCTERNGRKTVLHQDIQAAASQCEVYDFLIDIVPRIASSRSFVLHQTIVPHRDQQQHKSAAVSPSHTLPQLTMQLDTHQGTLNPLRNLPLPQKFAETQFEECRKIGVGIGITQPQLHAQGSVTSALHYQKKTRTTTETGIYSRSRPGWVQKRQAYHDRIAPQQQQVVLTSQNMSSSPCEAAFLHHHGNRGNYLSSSAQQRHQNSFLPDIPLQLHEQVTLVHPHSHFPLLKRQRKEANNRSTIKTSPNVCLASSLSPSPLLPPPSLHPPLLSILPLSARHKSRQADEEENQSQK